MNMSVLDWLFNKPVLSFCLQFVNFFGIIIIEKRRKEFSNDLRSAEGTGYHS